MLPHLIWVGFLIVVVLLFGERLTPATPVELETVVALEGSSGDPSTTKAETKDAIADASDKTPITWDGEMQFQASGWIEADPFPIRATALISGVVDKVHVLEGERVKAGQLLATLISEDAEYRLDGALQAADAAEAGVGLAEANREKATAMLETLRGEISAAERREEEARDLAERLEAAGAEAFTRQELISSRLQALTRESETAAVKARIPEMEAEIRKAEAELKRARANLGLAKTRVREARLALERTEIPAPVDGVVQQLLVAPGMKRMLEMDEPDSATICILYQPDQLQARIDVALEDAAGLRLGQPVRIRTNFLPEAIFRGEVTRILGEADLQRNTLQVKVKILNPDPRLRPDFLCRAEFLTGGESSGSRADLNLERGPGGLLLFVPEAALAGSTGPDRESTVWRLDPSGERLEKQRVRLGRESREGYVAILKGLLPGDRVVMNPGPGLKPGDRVREIPKS